MAPWALLGFRLATYYIRYRCTYRLIHDSWWVTISPRVDSNNTRDPVFKHGVFPKAVIVHHVDAAPPHAHSLAVVKNFSFTWTTNCFQASSTHSSKFSFRNKTNPMLTSSDDASGGSHCEVLWASLTWLGVTIGTSTKRDKPSVQTYLRNQLSTKFWDKIARLKTFL